MRHLAISLCALVMVSAAGDVWGKVEKKEPTPIEKCQQALVPPYAAMKLRFSFGAEMTVTSHEQDITDLRETIRTVNPTYRSNRQRILARAQETNPGEANTVTIFSWSDSGKGQWFPNAKKGWQEQELTAPDAYKQHLHACDDVPELHNEVQWQLALLEKSDSEITAEPRFSAISGDIMGVKYPGPPADWAPPAAGDKTKHEMRGELQLH